MRALQTLGISEDPPGDSCKHQEACRKEQKLPRSLSDLLVTIEKKPRKTGLVLATQLFSGSMGCLGGCILGSCTSVWPLIIATVRTRCARGATTPCKRFAPLWAGGHGRRCGYPPTRVGWQPTDHPLSVASETAVNHEPSHRRLAAKPERESVLPSPPHQRINSSQYLVGGSGNFAGGSSTLSVRKRGLSCVHVEGTDRAAQLC